ncbi:DUF3829 domain-containing protein [Aggregatimonas sangjinii]|uniref:DUF3829 domain-containing protein n=1 Tax=Aggregatimonas sangjinii TaxID=2583587 RepID=A0A5B7SSV0_9FLAO|nr:DUF3829 domain-containing protein [Aggregatimonas sangjinii]QCX00399.1 DUF3829 domain-containing protein [Aggregatimonas sangjinii]
MKITKTLALFLLTTLILQSCKETSKTDSSEGAITTSNTAVDANDKQAFINKYNVYVDVWNSVSPSIERSYSLIMNNLDDTGRPFNKRDNYFISKPLSARSIEKLKAVIDENPEIPELDEIGKELAASFTALETPLEKLSDYYKAQSYLDDDFKTSVTLYPTVMENMTAYLQASDALGKALKEIDERLLDEELKNYKDNGYDILYTRGMLLKTIKEQTAVLRGIEYDAYESIDFDSFDAKLKEVVALHSQFKELSKNVPQLKKELNISIPARLTLFNSAVDKFVRESRNLKKLATNAKSYARMKSTVESMGINFANESHIKVFKAAEDVINQSNNMR